jgi:uncharacterized protein (TIGR02145 family)
MPKIAALFTLAFAVLSLTACDDIREEKYPNGKVRSRVQYVENAKQGVETEYYENGNVKRTRNFEKGKEQGESKEYYESGKLKAELSYTSGAVHGTVKRYYENGNVQSITLYEMGTIAAFPETFDMEGDPEVQGSYTDPRDGNKYEWVRLGDAVWTAENIKFAPVKGSLCMQCNVWGRLYNWESAQNACPTSFRMPKIADFEALAKAVGKNPAKKLKATFGWNDGGDGTDEFNFGLRASGAHFAKSDVPEKARKFKDAGDKAYFWTADGKVAVFKKNSSEISYEKFQPEFGASLRCILAK